MTINVLPLNTASDGTAYTVRARCGAVGLSNLTGGGGHFAQTGAAVIETDTEHEYNNPAQHSGGQARPDGGGALLQGVAEAHSPEAEAVPGQRGPGGAV